MARIKRAQIRKTRKKNLFRQRPRLLSSDGVGCARPSQARLKAEKQEFIGRKQRKRQFRRLWTQRINAAARQHGLSYSRFIHGLKRVRNRHQPQDALADLAVRPSPQRSKRWWTQAKSSHRELIEGARRSATCIALGCASAGCCRRRDRLGSIQRSHVSSVASVLSPWSSGCPRLRGNRPTVPFSTELRGACSCQIVDDESACDYCARATAAV